MQNQTRRLAKNLFFMLLCNFILFCTVAYPQPPQRVIEKESWQSEPIKVLKVRVRQGIIELGKKFDGGDDWLNGLTATIENTSDKAVARIVLRIDFPRPEQSSTTEPTYVARMMFGRDPSDADAYK